MDAKEMEGIIRRRVLDALVRYRDDDEAHDVPSPSGISGCFRRQWCAGTHYPQLNPDKPAWIKKQEQGRLVEPFWHDVFNRAGFSVADLTNTERLQMKDSPMTGKGDGIIADMMGEIPIVMMLELKDLGMFTYLDFMEKGLKEGLPYYWYQVQDYLEIYDLPFGVVFAGQADASAITWWHRTRNQCNRRVKAHDATCAHKQHGEDKTYPEPFVVEVVPKAPADIEWTRQRSLDVRWYIDNEPNIAKVPRDFDPSQPKINGKNSPCNWCPFRGGLGDGTIGCLEAGE